MDTIEWYAMHGPLPQDAEGKTVSFQDMEMNSGRGVEETPGFAVKSMQQEKNQQEGPYYAC